MDYRFTVATLALCLAPTALAQDVVLSEIRVDEPGFDLSEYVELSGVAGTSLDGLSIVVVGDGDAGSPNGVVESVIALSGSMGASGRFLVAEATFSLAATPDLYADFEFESSDNTTFFLVSGFTGGVGTDLDTNDDGTLDSAPWSALLSSVALVRNATPDGVNEEFFYSATTVGPSGGDSPAHAFLCADSASWKAGSLDTASGSDTPGAANPACGSTIALAFSELRTKQPGNDIDEYVEFVGTPGASLAGLTYVVIGDRAASGTTPADYVGYVEMALPLDGAVVPSDGRLVIAEPTVSFPLLVDWVTPADGLKFEDNGTARTHLVVSGWSGAIDTDLDTNNDGNLESTPWLSVITSVAFLGPFTTDHVYSPDRVPADVTSTGTYTAGHAYTCTPTGTWTVGAFTFYAGGGDTPGAANRDCAAGPVPECGEAIAGACNAEHATPFCSDLNCCNSVCIVDPDCCVTAWDAACVAQAATSCAVATASCEFVDVRLNEIRIDMPGTDTLEFVELAGTPGTSLDGLTLIVIGDGGSSPSGYVERVRSLAGFSIPRDGTLLIGNPATNPDVGNGAGANGANVNNDWLENSDNLTFFLVRGWSGALNVDLDTNDDGTLDLTPWIEIIDGIALVESATTPPVGTEYAYGSNRIGPDGVYVPGHVWRCQDTGCWNIGLFDIAANTAAGNETPGRNGVECDEGTCAGDLNADGIRDGADLGALLAGWGTSSGDVDDDGTTDGADLGAFLAVFGQPCE
jgi:hypothetical protein